MNISLCFSALLLAATVSPVVHAQPGNAADAMMDMRQSVELLSTTLEEGLGLNERRGVFSPRAGDIRGRYLQGHGIVLEVSTPLQTREGFTMDAFSNSLSQLSTQLDGMLQQGSVARPDFDTLRDQLALSLRSDDVATYYRGLMQQLQSVQDIPAIERALASSASTLQSLGQIDPDTRERLAQQLQNQRTRLQAQMTEWDQLRRQIRDQSQQSDALPDESVQQAWAQALARLDAELADLRSGISALSVQLQQQREQAERVRMQQAAAELEAFQSRMFVLLCDYAAGLRSLPPGESLDVVLVGVGDSTASETRRDVIYQIDNAALQSCLLGQTSAVQLREQSVRYQY